MEVTLKNVKFYERMSEETNAFTADVFINGKKAGYAKNDGHGGDTNVRCYPETRELFYQGEGWLKGQGQINIGTETDPYMVDCDMESKVDQLFEQWLKDKETKRFEKMMGNHLMWGVPNGRTFVKVKFIKPLNQIDRTILQKFIDKYKKDFKEGEKYLNTNLVGFDL